MQPKVSLVLPNFNNEQHIQGAVESILDTVGAGARLFVIDDGSTDASVSLLRKMKGFTLIEKEREGIAKTLNLGFRLAETDDVVRLDGDIVVETNDWLAKLQEVAYGAPNAGVVGVKSVFPDHRLHCYGRSVISALGLRDHYANMGGHEFDRGQFDTMQPVDAVLGTMAYYRRDVLDALGGIDETFYPTWIENDDFCIAARAKNFEVFYQPAVRVTHYCGNRPGRPFGESKEETLRRHFQYWQRKWGWNPEFPDLHAIRKRWGDTRICWRIGEALLDYLTEQAPLVDVLIVTWNNKAGLVRCLESLRSTTYPAARLWILDNGSTDGTEEALKSLEPRGFPWPLKVVRTPVNIGLPAGMNWLVKTTDAPLVARLDDDVVVSPDWLTRMAQTLREHPYAGVVAPKVLDLNRPERLQFGHLRLWPDESYHLNEVDRGQCDYVSLTTHACGCCLLYRRKVFAKAGLFDIRYSPSQHDDLDHFISVRSAGYDVLYDGTVAVRHPLTNGADCTRKAVANSVANLHKLKGKWNDDVFEVLERSLDLADRRNTHPVTEKAGSIRETLYANITQLIADGNLADGGTELERFISSYPDDARARNDLGTLAYYAGDTQAARQHFERALALNPQDLTARKNLADLCIEIEEIERALELYSSLLEENLKDVEALLGLARVSCKLHRLDSAAQFYERVLDLDPGNAAATRDLEALAVSASNLWAGSLPEGLDRALSDNGFTKELEGKTPSVSILIPGRCKETTIQKCLASVLQNTEYLGFEVLLVEEEGNEIKDWVEGPSHGRMKRIVTERNLSLPAALNAAASSANGEYLVFLNPHTVVAKGWLQALLRVAVSRPNMGGVTGRVVNREEAIIEAGCSNIEEERMQGRGVGASHDLPQYNHVCEVDSGSRFLMLISKQDFLKVGGFETILSDWCVALIDLGLTVRQFGGSLWYQPLCTLLLDDEEVPAWGVQDIAVSPEALDRLRPDVPAALPPLNGNGRSPRKKALVLGTYLADSVNAVDDMAARLAEAVGYEVTQRWVAIGGEPHTSQMEAVTVRTVMDRCPKFEILNQLVTPQELHNYDYLIVADDDIVMPHNFLDHYLTLQEKLQFVIAQPARTCDSSKDHPIVEQHIGLLARQTHFVEIGPLVSFHRSVYDLVFPFSLLAPMGWGYENVWARQLGDRQLKMGIIDALPVNHTIRKPVISYSWNIADRQRAAYLSAHEHLPYEECFTVLEAINL